MSASNDLGDRASSYLYKLASELERKGVLNSPKLKEAFLSVPRHLFIDRFYKFNPDSGSSNWTEITRDDSAISDSWMDEIYRDTPLVTAINGENFPISSNTAPWLTCLMLDALKLNRGQTVLEIGTGTGYTASLLAKIVGDPKLVTTIEIDPDLVEDAERRIRTVLKEPVSIHVGDGLNGYSKNSPYDRIYATASYHRVPIEWLRQLRGEGVLILNLKGLGRKVPSGIFRIEKSFDESTSTGRFLEIPDRVGFISLQDSSLPTASEAVMKFSAEAFQSEFHFSERSFNPIELFSANKSGFRYLILLKLPDLYVVPSNHLLDEHIPHYIIDMGGNTLLAFQRRRKSTSWTVKVKGHADLWEKISRLYQWWENNGRPQATEFLVGLDEEGNRTVSGSTNVSI